MTAEVGDIAAMGPAMELTLERPATLRCAGTLDTRTRRPLLAALEELLSWDPAHITIDVSELRLGDRVGAGALVHLQRAAQDAGVRAHWIGLDAGRLHLMRYLDLTASLEGATAMRALPRAS